MLVQWQRIKEPSGGGVKTNTRDCNLRACHLDHACMHQDGKIQTLPNLDQTDGSPSHQSRVSVQKLIGVQHKNARPPTHPT